MLRESAADGEDHFIQDNIMTMHLKILFSILHLRCSIVNIVACW